MGSHCLSLGWQQLPQLPKVTPCLCFSLPPISQNSPETRNQVSQLLPGESDRPLPQAGTYSSVNGNIPREQPSPPPPLHALLAWIPSSRSLFSLSPVVLQGGAAGGGLGSVSVTPKGSQSSSSDRGAGTGILGGFFLRDPWEAGGRRCQENPTGALSLPSFGFWGPGEQEWGSGEWWDLWWDHLLSTPGRTCASQPQGGQEYPAPVGMEKQGKVRKMGKNWGKSDPEVMTFPTTLLLDQPLVASPRSRPHQPPSSLLG